jgi:transposase InsO family protein
MKDGSVVPNDQVVADIRKLLNQEFVDYGYIKVTHYLNKRLGYLINRKKVYRLMKEHKLLNSRRVVDRSPRLWVEDLVPDPQGCFEHLEIDIKYIYVAGTRTNILQLTVIDVKTRYVLGYCQGYSIKYDDVIRLFNKIFAIIRLPKSYYVRSDNGSQFVAGEVRKFFEFQSGATHEFTKPATPQQNAHIEAFHSIINRVICQRFYFDDFKELKNTMQRFIKFYNTDRIHSGIDYESPLHEIRKTRPNFKPVWVADYSNDNPLLSNQLQGLALEEDAKQEKNHYIT